MISFPDEKSGFPICTNYCKQTCHSEWPLGDSITMYFPISKQKGKRPLTFSSTRKEKCSFKNLLDGNSNIVIFILCEQQAVQCIALVTHEVRAYFLLIFHWKYHLLVSTKPDWPERLAQWNAQTASEHSWSISCPHHKLFRQQVDRLLKMWVTEYGICRPASGILILPCFCLHLRQHSENNSRSARMKRVWEVTSSNLFVISYLPFSSL